MASNFPLAKTHNQDNRLTRWFLVGILTLSAVLHAIYIIEISATPYINHPLVDDRKQIWV